MYKYGEGILAFIAFVILVVFTIYWNKDFDSRLNETDATFDIISMKMEEDEKILRNYLEGKEIPGNQCFWIRIHNPIKITEFIEKGAKKFSMTEGEFTKKVFSFNIRMATIEK